MNQSINEDLLRLKDAHCVVSGHHHTVAAHWFGDQFIWFL